MKLLIIFIFILSPMFSFAEQCVPRVDSCGYYLCEEKNHLCGPQGYPLGFGFKFCQVFLKSEQNYSPEAQIWLRKVRLCLMKEFQEANDSEVRTCSEIKKVSFRSHIDCYISTGFCDLSAIDKLQIFWPMRTNFIHPEAFQDVYSVAQECSSRIRLNPEALSAQR